MPIHTCPARLLVVPAKPLGPGSEVAFLCSPAGATAALRDPDVTSLARALRRLCSGSGASLAHLNVCVLPRAELIETLLDAAAGVTNLHVEVQTVALGPCCPPPPRAAESDGPGEQSSSHSHTSTLLPHESEIVACFTGSFSWNKAKPSDCLSSLSRLASEEIDNQVGRNPNQPGRVHVCAETLSASDVAQRHRTEVAGVLLSWSAAHHARR